MSTLCGGGDHYLIAHWRQNTTPLVGAPIPWDTTLVIEERPATIRAPLDPTTPRSK